MSVVTQVRLTLPMSSGYDPRTPCSSISSGLSRADERWPADVIPFMTTLSMLRPLQKPTTIASLAMLVTFAWPAGAQGPAAPAESGAPAIDVTATAVEKQLAANLARLTLASTPRPVALAPASQVATVVASADDLRDSIVVSITRTAVGRRYARGGQSLRGGFDCSGLVRYVMTAFDVVVPRTAAQLAATGFALGRDTTRLRPGDLLTFGAGARSISHVGIYVGNGRYVHASSVAGGVIESELQRPRSARVKPWRGSRRLLSAAHRDSVARGDG